MITPLRVQRGAGAERPHKKSRPQPVPVNTECPCGCSPLPAGRTAAERYSRTDTGPPRNNRKTDKLIILGVSKAYYENHPLIPYIKSCIKWYEMLDSGLTTYKEVYSKVHRLRNDYCGFKLPLGCYRELAYENPYCLYDTTTGMCSYHAQLPELDKERYTLMINYNFTHFIVPFINILPSLKNKEIKRYDSRTWRQNSYHG